MYSIYFYLFQNLLSNTFFNDSPSPNKSGLMKNLEIIPMKITYDFSQIQGFSKDFRKLLQNKIGPLVTQRFSELLSIETFENIQLNNSHSCMSDISFEIEGNVISNDSAILIFILNSHDSELSEDFVAKGQPCLLDPRNRYFLIS